MKTKYIFLLLILISCATSQLPKKQYEVPIAFRTYKMIVYYCSKKILDTPSKDVLRLDRRDDPAIGKVMDGEIFECVDKTMEEYYENRQSS